MKQIPSNIESGNLDLLWKYIEEGEKLLTETDDKQAYIKFLTSMKEQVEKIDDQIKITGCFEQLKNKKFVEVYSLVDKFKSRFTLSERPLVVESVRDAIVKMQGMKKAYGKISWDDGSYYDGDLVNGIPNGKGTLTYPNGDVYQGTFLNDQKHGEGIFTYKTPVQAAQYHLQAAEKCFLSKDENNAIEQCKAAFDQKPQEVVTLLVEQWKGDIASLFPLEKLKEKNVDLMGAQNAYIKYGEALFIKAKENNNKDIASFFDGYQKALNPYVHAYKLGSLEAAAWIVIRFPLVDLKIKSKDSSTLADLCERSDPSSDLYKKRIILFNKAADAGHVDAMVKSAEYYKNHPGEKLNDHKDNLESACHYYYLAGEAYREGGNIELADKYYTLSSEHNHKAHIKLAKLYTKQDTKKAFQHYFLAAQQIYASREIGEDKNMNSLSELSKKSDAMTQCQNAAEVDPSEAASNDAFLAFIIITIGTVLDDIIKDKKIRASLHYKFAQKLETSDLTRLLGYIKKRLLMAV